MADDQVAEQLAPQTDPHAGGSQEQFSPAPPAMPQAAPSQPQPASDPYAGAVVVRPNKTGVKPPAPVQQQPQDPYAGATILKPAEAQDNSNSFVQNPTAGNFGNAALEALKDVPEGILKSLENTGAMARGAKPIITDDPKETANNIVQMLLPFLSVPESEAAEAGATTSSGGSGIGEQMKKVFGAESSPETLAAEKANINPEDIAGNASPKLAPARESADKLQAQLLESEGKTAKQIGDAIAAKKSSTSLPVVALDAMQGDVNGNLTEGRSFLQMAAAAANKPGEASALGGNLLAREPYLRGHLNDALDDSLSEGSFYGSRDEALGKLATEGKAAQQEAFAQTNVNNDRIQQFLQDKDVQAGLRHGYNIQKDWALANNEPFNPHDYGVVDYNEAGDPVFGNTPNMKALDAARKGMQNMVDRNIDGRFTNPTTGKATEEAAAFMAKKKAFTDALKEANPKYADYLNKAGDEMERLDALNRGRDFTSKDPEEIDAFLNGGTSPTGQPQEGASEGAKAFYKVGVRRNIADQFRQTNGDAAVLNNLWKGKIQDRLAPVMDKEQLEQLNQHIQDQKSILRSNRAFGGSNTFDKFQANQAIKDATAEPIEAHAATASRFIAHPLHAGADMMSRMLSDHVKNQADKMSNETAAELMKDYTTNDPQHWYDLSKRLGEK